MNGTEFWNHLFSKSGIATNLESRILCVSKPDDRCIGEFRIRENWHHDIKSNESSIFAGHKKFCGRAIISWKNWRKPHTILSRVLQFFKNSMDAQANHFLYMRLKRRLPEMPLYDCICSSIAKMILLSQSNGRNPFLCTSTTCFVVIVRLLLK